MVSPSQKSVSQRAPDSQTLKRAYDRVGYDAGVSAQTHPCQIGGKASLFGVIAPDVRSAKILEVGCALGQNLIPIASSLPESVCIGVDISRQQIEHARREAQALNLTNVAFIDADIIGLAEELGAFDYIICHGVYSWVAHDVRGRIFEALSQLLSPTGLLYVSYNTLPGWSECGALRSLVQQISPGEDWSESQIPLVDRWITALPSGHIKSRYEHLWFNVFRDQPDFYKRHGIFAEFNVPRLLTELVNEAELHNLFYVTDAALHQDFPTHEHAELSAQSKHLSRIEQIQLLDFARHTTFRSSIFSKHPPHNQEHELNLTSLSRLSVISKLIEAPQHPQEDETRSPPQARSYQERYQPVRATGSPIDIELSVANELIAAANRSWPQPLPLKPYLERISGATSATSVVTQLITLIIHDHADVYIDVPRGHHPQADDLSDTRYRPQLSAYNLHYMKRDQAHLTVQGLHDSTQLNYDQPWFPFISLFDGSRDREALVRDVQEHPKYASSPMAALSHIERLRSLEIDLHLFRQRGLI